MVDAIARRKFRVRFTAVVLGVAVVGLAGYAGFVAFVGSDRSAAAGVMVLAAGTGFAAFFSPCSFPLLLTFLTRRSADSAGAALLSALRVAAGAGLLLATVAALIAVGGFAVGGVVAPDSTSGRWFRLGVGVLLVLFGLRQSRLLRLRMRWLDAVAGPAARAFDPTRVSRRAASDLVYGLGYLLAGFGCTGPLLVGLAAQTLTVGATQTAWAFATTTIVFAVLLLTASVVVSTVTSEVLRPVRMTGPAVRRWGGYVLLAVGSWFILLAALPNAIFGS